MPKAARQSPIPPRTSLGTALEPSITSAEVDPWGSTDGIRMLLYGASGTGKTTLWATFPGPILCLICSGGNRPGELKSIDTPENRKKIKPVVIRSVKQVEDELGAGVGYSTIVLDHATGFADLIIKELLGLDDIPVSKARKAGKGESWSLVSQQQYGQLAVICKETFRSILNFHGNVIIVAQERTFGGKEDGGDPEILKPTVGAALTPSVTGWLNPACDYVVQTFKRPRMEEVKTIIAGKPMVTQKRGKGVDYCLRVEPHDTFMTKFRVPGGIKTDVIVDPTYDKIQAIIRGESQP